MKKLGYVVTLYLLCVYSQLFSKEIMNSNEYELRVTNYDYGMVIMGKTALSNNYITNVGTVVYTIYGFEILGEDSLCFQLPDEFTVPLVLNPGDTYDVHFEFTPTEEKEYMVNVNIRYDGLHSALMQLIGNGIATDVEEEQRIDVVISPNPATDYIEINNVILSETKDPVLNVKIFDVLGVEVYSYSRHSRASGNLGWSDEIPNQVGNDNQTIRFDISALRPGLYFVRVGGAIYKFIKI